MHIRRLIGLASCITHLGFISQGTHELVSRATHSSRTAAGRHGVVTEALCRGFADDPVGDVGDSFRRPQGLMRRIARLPCSKITA